MPLLRFTEVRSISNLQERTSKSEHRQFSRFVHLGFDAIAEKPAEIYFFLLSFGLPVLILGQPSSKLYCLLNLNNLVLYLTKNIS